MMRRQQATHVRPHHPNPTRVRPPACRLVTLRNAIRNSFKDVGKGWFNLGESSQETYEFSKLKKFLALTRFVMEDTLRFLVEDSAARFTTFMQARRAAAGRGGGGGGGGGGGRAGCGVACDQSSLLQRWRVLGCGRACIRLYTCLCAREQKSSHT